MTHPKGCTRGFPKKRKCKRCGKAFEAHNPLHVFCGSIKAKTGCSYLQRQDFYKTEKRRKWDRDRKKKSRKLNTVYSQRQRKLCREYSKNNKEYVKELNKMWRNKNIDKILFRNKQRMKRLKNIEGNHTYKEWIELKKQYKYKCAICGISEKELKDLWKDTQFTKLTKDHIIPISKGGTDYIFNIQPLCISCNSKKKDKHG